MIDWRHWHNEPFLVGGLILLAWFYAVVTGPWRDRVAPSARFERGKAWCFHGSLVIFYVAVGSPLDQIGERFLLSAHMLQHQLLIYPSAVLFLLGIPGWLADWLLGAPALRGVFRILGGSVMCGAIYVLTMSVWHVPALYEWALENKLVHVVEHFMFFGAALALWWPFFSPSREFPPASHAVQMMYLVAITIAMTPVFAYITFSQDPLYPTYEYAPRVIAGLSPSDDQIVAGALMKLGGMLVSFVAFSWAFYRWYGEERGDQVSAPRGRAFPG